MVPVVAARLRPVGSEPERIDQVYAGVPPVAWSAWEYAVPVVPASRFDEVMVSGVGAAGTEIEIDADAVSRRLGVSDRDRNAINAAGAGGRRARDHSGRGERKPDGQLPRGDRP